MSRAQPAAACPANEDRNPGPGHEDPAQTCTTHLPVNIVRSTCTANYRLRLQQSHDIAFDAARCRADVFDADVIPKIQTCAPRPATELRFQMTSTTRQKAAKPSDSFTNAYSWRTSMRCRTLQPVRLASSVPQAAELKSGCGASAICQPTRVMRSNIADEDSGRCRVDGVPPHTR